MSGPGMLPSPAPVCRGARGWLTDQPSLGLLAKSILGWGFPTMSPFYMEDTTHRIPPPQRPLELRFHVH